MTNREKIYLSAVVYARDAAAFIGPYLQALDTALSHSFENYDITIVDDCSVDDTVDRVRQVASNLPGTVNLINLAWRHGIELAMLAGTDSVIGDFVVEIERPEFSYPDDIFLNLYKTATSKGLDVVAASGRRRQRFTSSLFYQLMRRLSGRELELRTEDLRMLTRRVINRMNSDKKKVRYRKIHYQFSGFRFGRIEYQETTKVNHPGLPRKDRFRLGMDALILFTDLGTKLGGFFSSMFMLMSVGLGGYSVVVFLTNKDVTSGWTTLMLFLSLGFTGVFLVLTMLGKYLSIILTEVQQTQSYTIRSIDRIANDQ